MEKKKPIVLCILDGWGVREESAHNAIALAELPHWRALWRVSPSTTLNASEHFVGLPKGQMGNSEVGHMNIGSGRPVRQLLPRINEAIEAGVLIDNEALQHFIAALKLSGGACHMVGIASDGGVHGHIAHILALMQIMQEAGVVTWLHLFTDGRDTEPHSARDKGFIATLVQACERLPLVRIASLGGRYYGMDRDNNWERIAHAYDAIVEGIGFEARDALDALDKGYMRGESDEFIKPSVMEGYEGMNPKDGIFMTNYRPDRARQLMQAFTMQEFSGFSRRIPVVGQALGLADYWSEDCPLTAPAMFPLEKLSHTLGEVLASAGKTQLRIAETEKFNHVTYFLSGANGTFEGEQRILLDSPKVATYDMQPEMSALMVTEKLVEAIGSGDYDFIAVNYANPDMVGHTGDEAAAIAAVEVVDGCLGRVREAVDAVGGILLVTADHGNVEEMRDSKGNPHTQHTTNPVPLIVHGAGQIPLHHDGALCDIAPTILALMDVPQPAEMTGKSLVV
jgi:2,3-bisphosphoglycerate-independent phosphoglycerate mutase